MIADIDTSYKILIRSSRKNGIADYFLENPDQITITHYTHGGSTMCVFDEVIKNTDSEKLKDFISLNPFLFDHKSIAEYLLLEFNKLKLFQDDHPDVHELQKKWFLMREYGMAIDHCFTKTGVPFALMLTPPFRSDIVKDMLSDGAFYNGFSDSTPYATYFIEKYLNFHDEIDFPQDEDALRMILSSCELNPMVNYIEYAPLGKALEREVFSLCDLLVELGASPYKKTSREQNLYAVATNEEQLSWLDRNAPELKHQRLNSKTSLGLVLSRGNKIAAKHLIASDVDFHAPMDQELNCLEYMQKFPPIYEEALNVCRAIQAKEEASQALLEITKLKP